MTNYSLPTDDLPPTNFTVSDIVLNRQLEVCLNEFFLEACDRSLLKPLLSQCQWYITTNADMTTLVIKSPNAVVNWQILEHVVEIAPILEKFAIAKIGIFSPQETEAPLEIRVSEMPVYRYAL